MTASSIVIDSSAFLAFLMPDEHDDLVEKAFELIRKNMLQVIVPDHFYIEVHNTLRYALMAKKPRITQAQFESYLGLFLQLGIYTENTGHNGMPMLGTINETQGRLSALRSSTDLAIKHGLSVYDAAYLELALRKKCKLLTLDAALADCAKKTRALFS